MDEEELNRTMQFIVAALEICEEPEKDYQFVCPLCGGEAHVSKASYNGHHRAYCMECKMNFIE